MGGVAAAIATPDPPTTSTAAPAGATLALITCSGDIDETLSSHEDNTVVFATLEGMYTG